MPMRYALGPILKQIVVILDTSPERVRRRAGLSATLADGEELKVDAERFFTIWQAMATEANRPGVEMDLAMA